MNKLIGSVLDFFGKADGKTEDEGKIRNPLKVPYDEDVFRANFPLIEIVKVPQGVNFPVPDKFEGAMLNEDIAMDKWIKRIVKAENYSKDSDSVHSAMFEALGDFTRIAPHEAAMVGGSKRKWEQLDEEDEGETEANEGVFLDYVEGIESNSWDWDEAWTGYVDGIIHVWDRRAEKRAKANDRSSCSSGSSIQTRKVVGILERNSNPHGKEDENYKLNACFQGGFAAVKHGLVNIQNGHGTPIYIIVMTADHWSYGQLVPHGFVQLKDGRIDPDCREEFSQHQQLTGHSGRDFGSLQQALDKGCTGLSMRKHNKDGPQLVGTLYLSSEWFPLPRTGAVMGRLQPGVYRFFDGLMRLVIGDSVLGFSSEDFERILARRKEFVREQLEILRP